MVSGNFKCLKVSGWLAAAPRRKKRSRHVFPTSKRNTLVEWNGGTVGTHHTADNSVSLLQNKLCHSWSHRYSAECVWPDLCEWVRQGSWDWACVLVLTGVYGLGFWVDGTDRTFWSTRYTRNCLTAHFLETKHDFQSAPVVSFSSIARLGCCCTKAHCC